MLFPCFIDGLAEVLEEDMVLFDKVCLRPRVRKVANALRGYEAYFANCINFLYVFLFILTGDPPPSSTSIFKAGDTLLFLLLFPL